MTIWNTQPRGSQSRRAIGAALLLLLGASPLFAAERTVRIGVFSLFHPKHLAVRPASDQPLQITGFGKPRILEGNQSIAFDLNRLGSSTVAITSTSGQPADLLLSVPGKIERRFHGRARIASSHAELLAVIEMDLETAVASVVAAELPPGTPMEALKAQAIVARSFLTASHGRHTGFDFCDTTHCQFLRALPSPGKDAYRAAAETRGLLLFYDGQVFPPLYSAACGGHTRSLRESDRSYPYQSVACDYCLHHLDEPVRGHRFGLCQQGAAGMAASGASCRQILNHYYPATSVEKSSIY